MNKKAAWKYRLLLAAGFIGPFILQATDQTVDGKLTVNQDLKAGASGAANLEFRADGTLISKGAYTGNNVLTSGEQGTGVRFLWYPDKIALRAGYGYGSLWDDSNIGIGSVGLGHHNLASGYGSIALGYEATATGQFSLASAGSTVPGYASVGFGYSYASGWASMACNNADAYGDFSAAFGCGGIADGFASAAFGEGTLAQASHSFAVGRFNVSGGNNTSWVSTDPLFEVGNGTPETASDAFVVYKNGNAAFQGVVQAAPGGDIPMFSGP